MIKLLDKFTFLGPVGHRWVACGLPDPCGLRKRLPLTNIPQAWQEAERPREGGVAEAAQHPQRGLPPRTPARRSVLMPVTTGLGLLRVMDERLPGALQRLRAAGGLGRAPTARVPHSGGGLLPRRDGPILDTLHHHGPWAAHPGAEGRPVWVIMAPARRALLAATTRPASQRLRPPLLRVSLLRSAVRACIRCTGARPLPLPRLRPRGMAQPPAPPRAGAERAPHLAGAAASRARQTPPTRHQNPRGNRPLPLVPQGVWEIVAGALAAVAPGACAPGSVGGMAPRIAGAAGASRPWHRAILPSARLERGVAGIGVEALGEG